jgi:glycosyltransferase involved in cell wall biosynthesis
MRVCVCASQVPFSRGGAEIHVDSLVAELRRRGFETELVTVPYSWNPRLQLLQSALAWRLLDLRDAAGRAPDLVIATKFPSYLVRHDNKVVWLIHQFRQVYDLLGTPYSDFADTPEDHATARMIHAMDRRALSEADRVYTNARNTADRLRRFNGLEGTPLYVPPQLGAAYHAGDYGDYVLAVGRLDPLKRFDLLVRSMGETETPVRCKIAGTGPQREPLESQIAAAGLGDRVELLGWVDDAELLRLYAGSLAVFYAPYDEDYGYITVEAFKSSKAVLAATDSGGVLEFVEDERSGFVCPPDSPRAFARRLDLLFADRRKAAELGAEGARRVAGITWDGVIRELTEGKR